MRCPYCAKTIEVPVPVITDNGQAPGKRREPSYRELKKTAVYCNRVKPSDTEEADYEHSVDSEIKRTEWNELIAPDYKLADREHRTRFVSVVGDTNAGKTVWMLAVGAHAECPNPASNHLYPQFNSAVIDAEAANRNTRKQAIQLFPDGDLPLRTEVLRQAITLPLWVARDRQSWLTLPRWFKPKRGRLQGDGLLFVVKDVAGETTAIVRPADALKAADVRHLGFSDWHVFALNAGDDDTLKKECGRIFDWLQLIPLESQKRAIVLLLHVDERHGIANDPILTAVQQSPNRFPLDDSEPQQFDQYLRNMQRVDEIVRAHFDRLNLQQLVELLDDSFRSSTVRYTAASSLGLAPCPVKRHAAMEAKCITEPAMIHVIDPILWMLKAEQKLKLPG